MKQISGRMLPDNARLLPPEAQKVFAGEIFDVYQWQQEQFDGSHATYEMLKRPDTVCVLGVDDAGEVIVTDEEQPGGIVRKNTLPLGRMEPGEEPLEAAQREMREETGYEFGSWRLVDVVQPEKKIEWFVYLFVAQGVERVGAPQLDAGERIVVKRADFATVQANAGRYFPKVLEYGSLQELLDDAGKG